MFCLPTSCPLKLYWRKAHDQIDTMCGTVCQFMCHNSHFISPTCTRVSSYISVLSTCSLIFFNFPCGSAGHSWISPLPLHFYLHYLAPSSPSTQWAGDNVMMCVRFLHSGERGWMGEISIRLLRYWNYSSVTWHTYVQVYGRDTWNTCKQTSILRKMLTQTLKPDDTDSKIIHTYTHSCSALIWDSVVICLVATKFTIYESQSNVLKA